MGGFRSKYKKEENSNNHIESLKHSEEQVISVIKACEKLSKEIENSWIYIKSTIIKLIKDYLLLFSVYFCCKQESLMRKYYCLFFVFFLGSRWVIFSQELTAEDSLWIQRVQNGTENIRLNEATRKAIESGTLIRDPFSTKQLKTNPSEMPIVKSFENITMPENRPKPQELPVSVYKIYVKNVNIKDSLPVIRKDATGFNAKMLEELKALDLLTPRKATVDDPFTIRSGGGGFDAEGILRSIFWPSHRAKKRNAKNANAWKTYNEY